MSDKSIHTERKGHPSASVIERLYYCPGSWRLSKKVPPEQEQTTIDADTGIRIHEARATGDATELELSEADIVQQMAEDEERIYHKWLDDYQINDAEIYQERREWLYLADHPICSARIDFFALSRSKRMVLILDRKSGRKGVTPPTRNWQLKTSMVILASVYNLVGGRVAIIQPFAKRQIPCDYSPEDLYAPGGAWEQLTNLMVEIENPSAVRKLGQHCHFCPAKHICPEQRELIDSLVARPQGWQAVSPQEKRIIWDKCDLVLDTIKGMKGQIKRDLEEDPTCIPGLGLSKPTNQRSITNIVETYEILGQIALDKVSYQKWFSANASISVADIEIYVRERLGCTKDEAKIWVNEQLADVIARSVRKGHVIRVEP